MNWTCGGCGKEFKVLEYQVKWGYWESQPGGAPDKLIISSRFHLECAPSEEPIYRQWRPE